MSFHVLLAANDIPSSNVETGILRSINAFRWDNQTNDIGSVDQGALLWATSMRFSFLKPAAMLFTSIHYFLFLPIVVIAYYVLPKNFQHIVLLVASYVFYAFWSIPYAVLLFCVSLTTYLIALQLDHVGPSLWRKAVLLSGLGTLLCNVFVFKYYNFFSATLSRMLTILSISTTPTEHSLLLPIGISFYTFQAVSYLVDVYKQDYPAERRASVLLLYVAFFLVAGPIERPDHLLPQLSTRHVPKPHEWTYALQLILVGIVMKVVIADNIAIYVNSIYGSVHAFTGVPLLVATYFFSFQILCDFAGYSLVAIGSARLLGIRLVDNFKRPYFARSFTEFWRRWHISLSSWLKDYVYIPLGGNRGGSVSSVRNLALTFAVSGLWHGADWTFIVWGLVHAAFLIVERLLRGMFTLPSNSWTTFLRIVVVFHCVTFAWIFFRADSLADAWYIVTHLFVFDGGSPLGRNIAMSTPVFAMSCVSLVVLVLAHVWQEYSADQHLAIRRAPLILRWASYFAMSFAVLFLAAHSAQQFIYFQF